MAAVEGQNEQQQGDQPWFLRITYPVLFPSHKALRKSRAEFDRFIADELRRRRTTGSGNYTLASTATAGIKHKLAAMDLNPVDTGTKTHRENPASSSRSRKTLLNHGKRRKAPVNTLGKMLAKNANVAYRPTRNALVDLFFELEDVVTGPRLQEILEAAWADDPLSTLKVIFNARSVHLGRRSKTTFYRAAGWLAQNHPLTLVANLRWLSRPVIEQKVKKAGEDDFVITETKPDGDDPNRFDARHGVAHGYWKDLLNILALAVNDKLHVLANPRDLFNVEDVVIKTRAQIKRVNNPSTAFKRAMYAKRQSAINANARKNGSQTATVGTVPVRKEKTARLGTSKAARLGVRISRRKAAIEAFHLNPVYRALHLTVARLFAEQLQADIAVLRGSDSNAKKSISLCAKWAPSHDHFHDRHTFVISTIAEIMYPRELFDSVLSPTDDSETYIRYAREEYRKDISALRKHLEVVERDLTANTFWNIQYDRVSSIALHRYHQLFIIKDTARFETYIDLLAEGKIGKFSGAPLYPSTLVHSVDGLKPDLDNEDMQNIPPEAVVLCKALTVNYKVVDSQWNSLVQRIKDSGTLSSCLAVCDVSGSMYSLAFKDLTCPMDTAISLSLLIAEVTKPPFGGAFVNFHSKPELVKLDLSKPLAEKIQEIKKSRWDTTVNIVSVFEDLILPMAIQNKLKQEDMVKRVFVFSDVHFNKAQSILAPQWNYSYERIKKLFADAGYEMPELVFWNLAGGKAGYEDATTGSGCPIPPKQVTTTEVGTVMVAGYSHGMLKSFMDNGSFKELKEDGGEDDDEGERKGKTAESTPEPKKKDPLAVVKRVIGHKAYNMLKVLD